MAFRIFSMSPASKSLQEHSSNSVKFCLRKTNFSISQQEHTHSKIEIVSNFRLWKHWDIVCWLHQIYLDTFPVCSDTSFMATHAGNRLRFLVPLCPISWMLTHAQMVPWLLLLSAQRWESNNARGPGPMTLSNHVVSGVRWHGEMWSFRTELSKNKGQLCKHSCDLSRCLPQSRNCEPPRTLVLPSFLTTEWHTFFLFLSPYSILLKLANIFLNNNKNNFMQGISSSLSVKDIAYLLRRDELCPNTWIKNNRPRFCFLWEESLITGWCQRASVLTQNFPLTIPSYSTYSLIN